MQSAHFKKREPSASQNRSHTGDDSVRNTTDYQQISLQHQQEECKKEGKHVDSYYAIMKECYGSRVQTPPPKKTAAAHF